MKNIIVIVLLTLFMISCGHAALPWHWETSDGKVAVESIDVIIEDHNEHLNFPWMVRFDNGVIWLRYHAGTHTVSEHSESLWSMDNGLTWSTPGHTIRCLNTTEMPGGEIKSTSAVYPRNTMSRHTIRTYTWASPTSAPVTSDSYCDLPWRSTFLCHRSMVLLDDGSLISTGYGKVEGQDKIRAFCIKSSDNGASWSFLSTIAYDPQVGFMEGYNEPVLEKLENGNLICILRTNQFQPARKCFSYDNGATWTEPVVMAGNLQGVDPEMHLLSNGVLIATIGTRPGVDLYVDFTGTGNQFKKVDWPFFAGEGYYCSYTSLVEVEPGKVMFVICQSDFYTNPDWQFDGINTIQRAYLTVTPLIRSDLNRNGVVDLSDFSIFASEWRQMN